MMKLSPTPPTFFPSNLPSNSELTMHKNFKHQTSIQIRFKDIDKQGHVNNANHVTYFESGRVDYFAKVLGRNIDWDKTGILLARTEIDYFVPVFLDDEIFVYTNVSRLGKKSFDMSALLVKRTSEGIKECASGKFVLVCYDYTVRQTMEIPPGWKSAFENFEKQL